MRLPVKLFLAALVVSVLFIVIGSTTPRPHPATAAPAPTSAQVSRRNPTAAQLASYVVKVGEERCPSAKRTFFQGANETTESWNVECSTGKTYVVMLENAGTVRVMACSALAAISKVVCFKTFDEQR